MPEVQPLRAQMRSVGGGVDAWAKAVAPGLVGETRSLQPGGDRRGSGPGPQTHWPVRGMGGSDSMAVG